MIGFKSTAKSNSRQKFQFPPISYTVIIIHLQYITCLPRQILELFSLFRKMLQSKILNHFHRQNIEKEYLHKQNNCMCIYVFMCEE